MKKITRFSTTLILLASPMLAQAITYTYDGLNRLTSATYTDRSYVRYTYDPGGNITSIISSNNSNNDSSDNRNGNSSENRNNDKNKSSKLRVNAFSLSIDTDYDGIPDIWETKLGTNPKIADAKKDSNHNGYNNWQEYQARKHPYLDTDRDGMFDIDEIKYHTNPRDSHDCPSWYCPKY